MKHNLNYYYPNINPKSHSITSYSFESKHEIKENYVNFQPTLQRCILQNGWVDIEDGWLYYLGSVMKSYIKQISKLFDYNSIKVVKRFKTFFHHKKKYRRFLDVSTVCRQLVNKLNSSKYKLVSAKPNRGINEIGSRGLKWIFDFDFDAGWFTIIFSVKRCREISVICQTPPFIHSSIHSKKKE